MINWRIALKGVFGVAMISTPWIVSADTLGLSSAEISSLLNDRAFAESIIGSPPQVARHHRPAAQKPVTLRTNMKRVQTQRSLPQPRLARTSLPSHARFNNLPFEIRRLLNNSRLQHSGMSAYIIPADSRTPLLAHQEANARVPASVMKLVTTYAGLGILGKDYRWKTEVYTTGKVRGGRLNGDLIIKGYGAPDFSNSDLKSILYNLRKHQGIRSFNGRVIMDNSHFRVLNRDSGRFDGQRHAAYNAIPDALMYNERISRYTVKNVKGRARVYTSTPSASVKIVNKIRMVKSRCRGKYRRPAMSVRYSKGKRVVTFSGRFSRRCGTRSYSTVMPEPSGMIFSAMKANWRHVMGGQFKGRYTKGRLPKHARLLHTHYSKPLHEVIREVNKSSNNVMARQLLLTMGAHYYRTHGNEHSGEKAIKSWLRSVGLNFPRLKIENGSGLSRTARMTAKNIAELLHHAYNSPYRNILMQSMSIAGVDGTMKRRLKGTPVSGRGFFKTGTLRNVRSVAGYVKAVDGRTYIVAILHNDPKARRRALKAHDTLINWAYWKGSSSNLAMR